MKTKMFCMLGTLAAASLTHAQIQYSHGNPTADEQYMLELINRARANPEKEGSLLVNSEDPNVQLGISYFGVDVARLKREFASYPVRPPLAMNAKLSTAAQRHSKDMARNNFQSHTGSDRSTIQTRIREAGYQSSAMSENIYSNLVSSASFAHAGFAIDWGNGPGGVQPGLGHRVNVMGLGNASYREVGIGVSERSADDAAKYGKLAVTQDYGLQIESPFFLLGVAYQDQNENGAYDPGEGLPGIKVRPSVGEVFAITSASGGYAIPFQQSPGAASVVFSGEILPAPVTKEFSLVRENVKVDLRTGSSTITLKMQAIDKTAGETKASGGSALLSIVRGGLREELKVIVKRPVTKKTGIGTPNDYTIAAVKPARSGGTSNKDGTFVVLLPKGQSHADIKISAIKDEKIEGTEKVPFWLVKSPKYKLSKTDSATISIKD